MPYKDPEKRKAYRQQHYLLNKEEYRERNDAWKRNNRERTSELTNANRLLYPEKKRARDKVSKAIRSGKLTPIKQCICEDCGVQAQHYHHEDYSKPLEVNALCAACHSKRHYVNLSSRTIPTAGLGFST
jgi:hypothetical protein